MEPMRGPDAILVLGAAVLPGGRPGPSLARRCRAAASSAARWPDARLVVCGGRAWDGVVEADVMARSLVELGVDGERVVRERLSTTTVENLLEARAWLPSPGARVAIVTCAWHLPRALSIARAIGLDAVGVPAPAEPTGPLPRLVRAARERVHAILDARAARRRR